MSIENNSDEDDLLLSGHRSIFSSDGSYSNKSSSSLRQSQYDGYQWDFDENLNYHRLAFEQADSVSEWSMNFDPPRTSWREIRSKSLSSTQSDSSSPTPLLLYHLYQRRKSVQHPCYLYENFSDQSECDSNSSQFKIPTTFSQLKSQAGVDQCLQTSFHIPRSKSADRLSTNHSQSSSSTTRQSLPDLDFLTYYAKENPPTLTPPFQHLCTAMKTPLFQSKKAIRTIFYCMIDLPANRTTVQQTKESQRVQENETLSSVCSSSSSSGYHSNSSRPLKSCLKRTKTSPIQSSPQGEEASKHRRYSAPNTSSRSPSDSNRTCTFSEHDLHAKKNVSFCNEIARRLITPSASPKDRDDYCDLIPRESLTESPPNEFNLDDDDNHEQLINFIETTPEDLTKPLLIKCENDPNLVHLFANTILRILEIKCNDPKSFYLNNQTNHELDRVLRQDLCSLLREILEDGLRQNSTSFFSKKINLWRLIELTTPAISRLDEAKIKSQLGLPTTIDPNEKFNAFIYQLLNFHELPSWLTHFLSQETILKTYYESSAFILVNMDNNLFENITNQLEKLSPLSFRLKYIISSSNQRSIFPKKFQVRTWLRDRKTQVKISPTPPNVILRRKFTVIKQT